MSRTPIRWLAALVGLGLALIQPALASVSAGGTLVSTQWLAENLKRDDLLIIDASPAPLHKANHIPGAVNVDVFTFGGRENPVSEMEQRI